jgi:hypothetical protein
VPVDVPSKHFMSSTVAGRVLCMLCNHCNVSRGRVNFVQCSGDHMYAIVLLRSPNPYVLLRDPRTHLEPRRCNASKPCGVYCFDVARKMPRL